MKYILSILVALFFLAACSPKTVTPVKEEIVEEKPPKKAANPECITIADLPGSEGEETKVAYVLYRDLVKLEKYEEARPLWLKAYQAAPGGNGLIKYQYEDGIKIYKHLYTIAPEDKKKAYVDTIMSIYDQRVKCHPGDADYVMGRKAFDYYYYYKSSISEDDLFEMFKKTVDSKGEKTDYFVVNPFTKLLYDRVVNESVDKEEGRTYAMKIFDIVDYGTTHCKKAECEAWDIIKDYAPDMLERLEGVDDFYGCDYYTDKYYPRFLEAPTDCESIQLAYIRMVRGNCPKDGPKFKELEKAFKTNCKKQQSSSAGGGGYACYTSGDFKCAVEKFEAFANETTDMHKKAQTYMLIAKIYYRDIKNYVKSRQYALKAAEARPDWGDPYMLIGKLYASSGPLCGSGRGFNSQVVTWVAIDKFKKARSIDPEVREEANKLIANYSQYMPSKADIFQRSMKAGSTYKVKCWIQENTVIRTVD